MRALLARDRRDYPGISFAEAYSSNLELAVAGLRGSERSDWLDVLQWARDAFRAAWERSGTVGLSAALLDALDVPRGESAGRPSRA